MKCSLCKVEKPDEEFVWRNKALEIRHCVCKPCQKEKSKAHYHANKDKYYAKNKAYELDVQTKVNQLKSKTGCVDCGESDPRCLDFDHIDPTTKTDSIGVLVRKCSYESVLIEIAKCEVRCSNCHRKKTSVQFDWYKGHSNL